MTYAGNALPLPPSQAVTGVKDQRPFDARAANFEAYLNSHARWTHQQQSERNQLQFNTAHFLRAHMVYSFPG
jgi:hypothetical protein